MVTRWFILHRTEGIYELNERVLRFGLVYCEEAAASSQGIQTGKV